MPAMNHNDGAHKRLRGWGRIGIVFDYTFTDPVGEAQTSAADPHSSPSSVRLKIE